MIILAAMMSGALTGTAVARKRGGRGIDQLQYAAGYGIAFTILGVFATIFLDRMI